MFGLAVRDERVENHHTRRFEEREIETIGNINNTETKKDRNKEYIYINKLMHI